jgi:hypothetical protein
MALGFALPPQQKRGQCGESEDDANNNQYHRFSSLCIAILLPHWIILKLVPCIFDSHCSGHKV